MKITLCDTEQIGEAIKDKSIIIEFNNDDRLFDLSRISDFSAVEQFMKSKVFFNEEINNSKHS